MIHSHDLIRGEHRCTCGLRFPTVGLAMQHAQSRNAPFKNVIDAEYEADHAPTDPSPSDAIDLDQPRALRPE